MADNGDNFTSLVGLTCTVTTIGLFLSGVPTVRHVHRQKSAGDISPVPFVIGTVACGLWLAYSTLIKDTMVTYCNLTGLLLNSFYTLVFTRYVAEKGALWRQIAVAGAFVFAILAGTLVNEDPKAALDNLGKVASVVTILCTASPLIGLKTVITSKSTESLPFPLIFCSVLVSALWWLYGVLVGDEYTQVTNAYCTGISLVQLSLFAVYPSKPEKLKSK